MKLYAQDSTFFISMPLIEGFDTTHAWVDVDCTDCTTLFKRRIQSKATPIFQESGWGLPELDVEQVSYFRITLEHSADFNCPQKQAPKQKDFRNRATSVKQSLYEKDPDYVWVKNELKESRDSIKYLHLQYQLEYAGGLYSTSEVFFNYNNHAIVLTAECLSSNCEQFLKEISKAINKLEIKE